MDLLETVSILTAKTLSGQRPTHDEALAVLRSEGDDLMDVIAAVIGAIKTEHPRVEVCACLGLSQEGHQDLKMIAEAGFTVEGLGATKPVALGGPEQVALRHRGAGTGLPPNA